MTSAVCCSVPYGRDGMLELHANGHALDAQFYIIMPLVVFLNVP